MQTKLETEKLKIKLDQSKHEKVRLERLTYVATPQKECIKERVAREKYYEEIKMKFDAYLSYLSERNLKMQQTIIDSSNELEELKRKQMNSECLIHNDPQINQYWSEAVEEQK